MSEISEEFVTRTWQAMSELSSEQAKREMARAGREQPELLAFILGSIMDSRPEAQELGVYIYFVIHTIFKSSTEQELRPITAEGIERRLTRNEELLDRLVAAHPRFRDRTAHLEPGPQPFVAGYLVEALQESPGEEDPVRLTEEERRTLYLALKTAIDLLDEERQRAEAARTL
jgi:hypothetical protein